MPKNTSEPFAHRLRSLRISANLSVLGLARLAGIARQQGHAYESGQSQPKAEVLVALAKALGVSLAAFDNVTFGEQQQAEA